MDKARILTRLRVKVTCVAAVSLFSSGCTYYEHKTDVPDVPKKVASTLAVGDTRARVRSVLETPLVDAPTLRLVVYKKTGRDIGVGWIIAPWAILPFWGDATVAVVLVVYDDEGIVTDISAKTWEEENYRYEYGSVTAGGFRFLNTSSKEPATLLSPPLSVKEMASIPADETSCSLILVMGRCPMEKIVLDGDEIADFPYAGGYCEVEDSSYQPAGHGLYDTLIWKRIKPGMHRIKVGQRLRAGNFEQSFECRSGETVYAELIGHRYVRDSWYGRLEGDIRITKVIPNSLAGVDGLRFILWHSGKWYGLPK